MKWLVIDDYKVRAWVIIFTLLECVIISALVIMWVEYAYNIESLMNTILGTIFALVCGIGALIEFGGDIPPYLDRKERKRINKMFKETSKRFQLMGI
jgi:hypothetical protein